MLQARMDTRMLVTSPSIALKARRPRSPAFTNPAGEDRDRRARLAIELAVSRVFGVEAATLWQGSRGEKRIATARQVAMYLAHVSCGFSLTEVGRLFGRDRTTVAHNCLKIEVKRDDPLFDRALDLLGWALPAIVQRAPDHLLRH